MINSSRRIDVAVVGLGFGSAFAPIYQAHPAVGRVALVDTDQQRLADVGAQLSIDDQFDTLDALLAESGWDAVHLLTPVAFHAEQVIQILESGRDCACAVPMATSLADLDRIIEVAERTGRRYMMMETTLYSREFFHARALLKAGDLGRLTYYKGEHLQNLDGFPPYWLGFPPMHYVTHALSPALALAGARAESVRCLGSSPLTPDHVGVAGPGFGTEAGLFRLKSSDPDIEHDLVANITMSFFQLGRSYLEGFSVYGDAGALEWPQLEGGPMKEFDVLGVPGEYRGPRIEAQDVHPPNLPDLLPDSLHPFMDGGHGGSHPHLVHEFVTSIVEDRPSRIDPRVAATLTAPGICAHESALQDGAEVVVPDFGVVARVTSPADEVTPTVALIGALDTKGTEYAYLRDRFLERGARVLLVDTGVLGRPTLSADVGRRIVAERGGRDLADLVRDAQRNDSMMIMARGAAQVVADHVDRGEIQAVMGIGGSNAAYIMAECCAPLPLGFPKVLVSTIASGDTRAYVRDTDLTLVNPVVDINGLNRVTRPILDNAVDACLGMATAEAARIAARAADAETPEAVPDLIGITMFGVTTAAGTAVQQGLEAKGLESVSFHCTGVGGKTMETLIRSGAIQAVADLTTTELADDLVGGDCTAGPDRLTAAAERGIPQVVSVGALDMVNFWGRPVPEHFTHRRLLAHNPTVTLMRTNAAESAELGRRLADKINRSTGPVAVLFPWGGLSELSVPDGPFADADADRALFAGIHDHLRDDIDIHEFDTHINDPLIAAAAIDLLTGWLQKEHP